MSELISSTEEDDLDSLLLAHNPRFVQLLEEARQRVCVTGGVPFAEFCKQAEARDNTLQENGDESDGCTAR